MTNCALNLHGIIPRRLTNSVRRKDLRRDSVPWGTFLVTGVVCQLLYWTIRVLPNMDPFWIISLTTGRLEGPSEIRGNLE